jgi:biofilm PGA synthesis lipoprotein PgaB
VMTLDEVADLVQARRPLPPRAVVLTIDDADESVYDLAWPLLQKYGVKAHLFVPTAHVGTEWSGLQVCTWDQLQEMAASGSVILGSHSRDLHYKVKTAKGLEPIFWNPDWIDAERHGTALSELAQGRREHNEIAYPPTAPDVLTGRWAPVGADLLASRYDLAARAGVEAEWLAWPYGFAHGALDSIAKLLGYRGTVSLKPRAFSDRDSALAAGRYTLTAHSTLETVVQIVERNRGNAPLP